MGEKHDISDKHRNTDSNDLAAERTDLAEDRNIMAMERTFAGWMRTAFAAIGIGLAFRAVFGEFDPPWLARAIATAFILLGAFVALTAERRACRTFTRLNAHQLHAPEIPSIRWLGWGVTAGAVFLAIALWILHDG
ncbi:YidH family protein [Altererythrobacter sp. MTPC7]|uniref:YidH family protein n=1 Tax=Altererythrobacter sp. MTPC7 TaxID=3056567 RepID=UPI0036F25AB1